jgi:hypothetical protein
VKGSGRFVVGGALERSRGEGMTRLRLVASIGVVTGLAAALSAQAPSSNGKVDQKTIRASGSR